MVAPVLSPAFMIIESIKKYNWKGKKALIVEDDPSAAFLLKEILQHTNIKVVVVDSGLEAIDKCREDPDIDVVLLDLQIPGVSGFEAATLIKQARKDLPIIAQSAYALIEEKEKAIEAGCDAHISKPINTFDLLAAMDHFLKSEDLPLL
jgi:CheY-like chemotaxis protein